MKRRVRRGRVNIGSGSTTFDGSNVRGFCSSTFNAGYTQQCAKVDFIYELYQSTAIKEESAIVGRKYIYARVSDVDGNGKYTDQNVFLW